jgi:hypothetical protein
MEKIAREAEDTCTPMRRRSVVSRLPQILVWIAVLVLGLLCGTGAVAQAADSQIPDASVSGVQRQQREDPWVTEQKRELAKKQNERRQQDIKKDTDKLLELATELKQYVDKTNENIISIDVIKKAEQIEKLAHAVKEKMKGP